MDTIASASLTRYVHFTIATGRCTEFTDITDRLAAIVGVAGLRTGLVSIQTQHTTTAIVVNEHEPLLLDDFVAVLERTAPRETPYGHDDLDRRVENVLPAERPNGHAHCRALFLPSSVCLNVVGGALALGRWQRVFLVELDGPRDRGVSVMLVGEGWR
jgi:secondary thiamine-phosphate synthase enzyme